MLFMIVYLVIVVNNIIALYRIIKWTESML